MLKFALCFRGDSPFLNTQELILALFSLNKALSASKISSLISFIIFLPYKRKIIKDWS